MCKHVHMVAIDFDIVCVNIVNEQFIPNQMPTLDYDPLDEPTMRTINRFSGGESEVEKLVSDLNFYQIQIGELIEKFREERRSDKLLDLKNKLKRIVSSSIEINSQGPEEPETKKRRMTKQIRFF